VIDAVMPGRWAAPPAPAIIHFNPLSSAVLAYSNKRSGVRWALTIFDSQFTLNSLRILADFSIVGQSDWLPMIIPIVGKLELDIIQEIRSRGFQARSIVN
jgi:hypothetical protein